MANTPTRPPPEGGEGEELPILPLAFAEGHKSLQQLLLLFDGRAFVFEIIRDRAAELAA